MAFLEKILGKIIHKFWPEKIPEFAASMYIELAKGARTGFYQTVVEEIVKRIEMRGNVRNLLDIGTGPGFMLFEIAKLRPDLTLVGVDLSEKLIKFAEEERTRQGCHNVFFLKDDANNLTEFSEADCDFVISSGILHSLKNPALAIKEWLRVLKPGHDLWIYDPTVLIAEGEAKDSYRLKKVLKDMEKNLESRKDRLLFRLIQWISSLPSKPMALECIYKIIQDAGLTESVDVEDRGSCLKIAIIKNS